MTRYRSHFIALLFTAFALLWFAGSAPAQVPPPAPPQDHPIALVGGTIHTISGETIEGGTILFVDGKIVAVGKNVDLPPGTETINVAGKHVYPGLIDANTTIGLIEIEAVRATRDTAEVGDINANVRAEVAVNPDSEIIPVTRANGILVALTAPRGGIITGRSAAIMLDGWTWEDMTLKAPVALHVIWPRMQPFRFGFFMPMPPEQQLERSKKQLETLKQAFRDARAYYLARKAQGKPGVPPVEKDLRWEAMMPVFEGKLPVFVHADNVEQIESAVAWAQQEGIRITIVGGQDAPLVADLLKKHDIPVIVTPILTMPPHRWSGYDEAFTVPARLYRAGVRFCIGGEGGAAHERNLPYHAAMAVAFGLPREEGLRAITLYAAEILGIADRVGSLEPGKDATLIVTDGDPLDIRTHVEKAFIQGRPVDLMNRHKRLYLKYKEKYRQKKASSTP